jgi:hypothetical protein
LKLLLLIALAACGRIGFDAEPGADAAASTTAFVQDAAAGTCGGQQNGCAFAYQSIVAGGYGEIDTDTRMTQDLVQGACGGAGVSDAAVTFHFEQDTQATFTASASFDTIMDVLQGGSCASTAIACFDNPGVSGETFVFAGAANTDLTIVVDGKPGTCGYVQLVWTGY